MINFEEDANVIVKSRRYSTSSNWLNDTNYYEAYAHNKKATKDFYGSQWSTVNNPDEVGKVYLEADFKKNNDEFNKKFAQEQNNFNNLEEQCRLYKSEKLSPEGFCENAKITVEITDVNIQKEIEGINSIIIRVIYNDDIKEKKLLINEALN